MARAYKLLVGLTHVDAEARFYRRFLAGFDGRRGCEGCAKDVELMQRLAHYLGYDPLTPRPLLNENATRGRLLTTLDSLAEPDSSFGKGDILFLYLSCHGRTLADANGTASAPSAGRTTNMFLLSDGPLFNFEILARLVRLPEGSRVFTLFDCCHAGLGTNLDPVLLEHQADAIRQTIGLLKASPGKAAGSPLTAFDAGPLGTAGEIRISSEQLLSYLTGQQLKAQIAHFGAARDELTARGGETGSLFTRRFYQLYTSGGYELTYDRHLSELMSYLPARHEPVFEKYPPDAVSHFGERQPVLTI